MNLPDKLSVSPLERRWDDRFAQDLAMTLEGSGSKMPDLLKEYDLTADDLAGFSLEPLFEQRVTYWRDKFQNEGFTFRIKAQAQAEHLLDTSFDLIHGVDVSPAVKADLIKWTAKMAGYEPSKDTGMGESGVKIVINMGNPAEAPPSGMKVIEQE